MTERFSTTIIVVFIFIFVGLAGGVFAFYSLTIVSWWLPLTVGIAGAGAAAIVIRQRSNEFNPFKRLDRIGMIAGAGVLAAFLLLGCNFIFADSESTHVEETTVTDTYSKEHKRYRRGPRGRMIPTGETYKTFHITFRLTDGREKSRQVNFSVYRSLHKGDPYEVKLQKGLLGFPVLK